MCHVLPAALHDPKFHAAGSWVGVLGMPSMPGYTSPSFKQHREVGSRMRQVLQKSPRLITPASKGERSKLHCVTGLVCRHRRCSWLQEAMALAQLLPTLIVLFDSGNTQAVSSTLLCSLANPYPKSMSTQVQHSYRDCNV